MKTHLSGVSFPYRLTCLWGEMWKEELNRTPRWKRRGCEVGGKSY